MMGCRGRVQCANNVIHLIVEHVVDLSADLKQGAKAWMHRPPWWPGAVMKPGTVVAAWTVAQPKHLGVAPGDMYEPKPTYRHPESTGQKFSLEVVLSRCRDSEKNQQFCLSRITFVVGNPRVSCYRDFSGFANFRNFSHVASKVCRTILPQKTKPLPGWVHRDLSLQVRATT